MAASNSFGSLFRITTFGESHGPYIGVVIDGMPAGILIDLPLIEKNMQERRGGVNPFVTARCEEDQVEIISGIYEGKSTGAPICLLIANREQDPTAYALMKKLFRPGHSNFTYLHKYGIYDPRGGGRASGRETAARVAAGAFAKMVLAQYQIDLVAFVDQIGACRLDFDRSLPSYNLETLRENKGLLIQQAKEHLQSALSEKDSLGGSVLCITSPLPIGLGDPIYQKLPALIGSALLSIPACKGVEFGEGFELCQKRGSESNDPFPLKSNRMGGTLGGISDGMPLVVRAAFKATSTIGKVQKTSDLEGHPVELQGSGRHDPALVLRAPPVVEAMVAITLVDRLLAMESSKCSF